MDSWLVVWIIWNMVFIFHFIYGTIRQPLTNIVQDGKNNQPVDLGEKPWNVQSKSWYFLVKHVGIKP
jgi:hypothetical protein